MVSEFYKYVDEGNTEEILACIEKMPDVNMLDVCIPLYKIRGVLFQGILSNGYPIYYAVWKQTDISVMEALLEKGADLNIMADYDLPLECLLRDYQEDMNEKVQLFVEYGADISAAFVGIPGGWEQMSEYKKEERINLVIYLWECGVNERDYVETKYERSILHELTESVEVNYLEILYHNEQRPMNGLLNEKDANGETPLFYAVQANNFSNCEFLISEGADINIRNNEGKTAYDVAVKLGYAECIEILEP
ncbi:MAG: ankyrin repeat domain-containing protein [Lachnospiraceae bacterium]|nr:ankyrin repeat domain-containing protein [Lachnospiraceae bacterium]